MIKTAKAFAVATTTLAAMPLTSAGAQSLPTAPYLPLTMAQTAADAALEQCAADGYQVAVAIVDRSGNLKLMIKADGTGPHIIGGSIGKAFTSASIGAPTTFFAEMIVNDATLAGLRDTDPRMVILGGGLPIVIDDAHIGGIGVAGAPGTQFDENCAKAGLEAIGG